MQKRSAKAVISYFPLLFSICSDIDFERIFTSVYHCKRRISRFPKERKNIKKVKYASSDNIE